MFSFQLHFALRPQIASFGHWTPRDKREALHIGVSLKPAMLATVTSKAISVVNGVAPENKMLLKIGEVSKEYAGTKT